MYYYKIHLTFKYVRSHREESSLELKAIWLRSPERIYFTRLINHLSSYEISIFSQKCFLFSSERKVSQHSLLHVDHFAALLETSYSDSGFLLALNLDLNLVLFTLSQYFLSKPQDTHPQLSVIVLLSRLRDANITFLLSFSTWMPSEILFWDHQRFRKGSLATCYVWALFLQKNRTIEWFGL